MSHLAFETEANRGYRFKASTAAAQRNERDPTGDEDGWPCPRFATVMGIGTVPYAELFVETGIRR